MGEIVANPTMVNAFLTTHQGNINNSIKRGEYNGSSNK